MVYLGHRYIFKRLDKLLRVNTPNQRLPIDTRQEQTSCQRQDKIRTFTKDSYEGQDKIHIQRQEIIHHYKNTHIPLC